MEIEEYFGLFADIIKKFICYMTMLISCSTASLELLVKWNLTMLGSLE